MRESSRADLVTAELVAGWRPSCLGLIPLSAAAWLVCLAQLIHSALALASHTHQFSPAFHAKVRDAQQSTVIDTYD